MSEPPRRTGLPILIERARAAIQVHVAAEAEHRDYFWTISDRDLGDKHKHPRWRRGPPHHAHYLRRDALAAAASQAHHAAVAALDRLRDIDAGAADTLTAIWADELEKARRDHGT